MPNIIASLVVFSWPVAVYLLFRFRPRIEALGWSILGGYLILPTRVGIDLPLIPTIDKDGVPVLAAALCLALGVGMAAGDRAYGASQKLASPAGAGGLPFWPLVIVLVASPLITVMTNREPIQYGPVILPGLRLYDALSTVSMLAVMVLPFILAARYFASPASHVTLLKIIVLALLAYSLPVLFEIRMSPQLNLMLYGFFPHSFEQHMRAEGFRPLVFLSHGLWLAILMAMAVIAAAALWRQRVSEDARAGHWMFAALYLFLVLFLSNSLGAFAIACLFLSAVLLLGVRGQMLVAGIISLTVLLYPILRSTSLVPVDRIVAIAERISTDRAASLQFRLDNEDELGARAAQKPFAGWGGWGRNQIYDPETGRMTSVTDGAWILLIGVYGWLGYLAHFGLLTLPTLLLAFGRRAAVMSPATAGLALVMGVNLLDLLPNATLTPITWLVGGALAGFCVYRAPEGPPEVEPLPTARGRSWTVLTDPPAGRKGRGSTAAPAWHGTVPPARRMDRDPG